MAKFQPVYEHQDGRGHSVRYAYQRDQRRKERKKLEEAYIVIALLQAKLAEKKE